jgi:hypothetical protein
VSAGLAAYYEQLRAEAIDDSKGHGQGLGLFLHRGMLAWMRAWPRPSTRPEARPSPPPFTDSILPSYVRSQMTAVLAAMILGQQQEASCER